MNPWCFVLKSIQSCHWQLQVSTNQRSSYRSFWIDLNEEEEDEEKLLQNFPFHFQNHEDMRETTNSIQYFILAFDYLKMQVFFEGGY